MNTAAESFFGPPIHAYTRAAAIKDGVLVDVDAVLGAHKMRSCMRWPIACTARVWAWIQPTAEEERGAGQSVAGRLHDVMSMMYFAAVAAPRGQAEVPFQVLFYCGPARRQPQELMLVPLKMHVGPGDTGEPVVTLMLPEED